MTSHIKGHRYKTHGYCIEKHVLRNIIFRRGTCKKTWQRARLMSPHHVFESEPKYSIYYKTLMLILQYDINFKPQTTYFRHISLYICGWNNNAMASSKQKDNVTVQMKSGTKACLLELYSASLNPPLPSCMKLINPIYFRSQLQT